MTLPADRSYERAIATLNGLTGNANAKRSAAVRSHRTDNTSVRTTERFCLRAGLRWPQLDALSIVHVTGTKGKGSTCAMAEAILRRCAGIRTGMFVSPHLVRVEERISIDGRPLSAEAFARYFWEVFDVLDAAKEDASDMPFYFQFLTVMAFRVFVDERVDCAVVEVGIGGENDTTNVVRGSHCTAITSLGLEHTQLLGSSLVEIAWQKAGIAKAGSTMFVPGALPAECRAIIAQRADERRAELRQVPDWDAYAWPEGQPEPNGALRTNPMFRLNGSLAVQLAYEWMRRNGKRCGNAQTAELVERIARGDGAEIFGSVAEALLGCRWAGRFQRIRVGRQSELFVDGAHTLDSVRVCAEWFAGRRKEAEPGERRRRRSMLLFNVTGMRDAPAMLDIVRGVCDVQEALFAPNVAWTRHATEADGEGLDTMAEYWRRTGDGKARCFLSVEEVMEYVREAEMEGGVDVLVTGSLYMVGAVCEVNEAAE